MHSIFPTFIQFLFVLFSYRKILTFSQYSLLLNTIPKKNHFFFTKHFIKIREHFFNISVISYSENITFYAINIKNIFFNNLPNIKFFSSSNLFKSDIISKIARIYLFVTFLLNILVILKV